MESKTLTRAKVRRVWFWSNIQYREIPTLMAKKDVEIIFA